MDETNENAYEEDRSLVYLLDVIQILLNHEEVKAIYQKTYERKLVIMCWKLLKSPAKNFVASIARILELSSNLLSILISENHE
jgi:hypothetical protein